MSNSDMKHHDVIRINPKGSKGIFRCVQCQAEGYLSELSGECRL